MDLSRYFADLSDNNGAALDAKKLHEAGVEWIMLKLGVDGSQFPYYQRRADHAHAAGLHVRHYIYALPATMTAKVTVEKALAICEPYFEDGDRLDGDIEIPGLSPAQEAEWGHEFWGLLHDHGHTLAAWYAARAFMLEHPGFAPKSKNLHPADYSGQPLETTISECKKALAHLGHVEMLQFTDGTQGPEPHTLPGVGGPCDVSILV